MRIDFTHQQTAHCESGAMSNLISHYGIQMTEALTFGVGAGLFFGYIPFIRLNHLPLVTFRSIAGNIIKQTTRALNIELSVKTFRNPQKAMEDLDLLLSQGVPVGLQTGAYWLPYFPPAFRFHFNMHNLVVIGKEGTDYIISDPVFPEPVRCDGQALQKARFAKGIMSPRGKMYSLTDVPERADLSSAVQDGLKAVVKNMLKNPVPILGVKGIRFMANRLEKWPAKLGEKKTLLHLGQVIRMQEEIGTGGAGFRFIFAAFLQQAAQFCHQDSFLSLSERMTTIGDEWRHFAVLAARNCKGRAEQGEGFAEMANLLRKCADLEKELYKDIDSLLG